MRGAITENKNVKIELTEYGLFLKEEKMTKKQPVVMDEMSEINPRSDPWRAAGLVFELYSPHLIDAVLSAESISDMLSAVKKIKRLRNDLKNLTDEQYLLLVGLVTGILSARTLDFVSEYEEGDDVFSELFS